jgi:DNA-binding transcriptional regulator YdaS (Cro superfamily)
MKSNQERDASVVAAIAAVGSMTELSLRLGISIQAISEWKRVPAMRVLQVEQATGVPRHQLRPDLYPSDVRVGLAEGSLPTRKSSPKKTKGCSAQPQLHWAVE